MDNSGDKLWGKLGVRVDTVGVVGAQPVGGEVSVGRVTRGDLQKRVEVAVDEKNVEVAG